jgi:TrmH family RNA methyltransferase
MIKKYLPGAETPGLNSKILSELKSLRLKKHMIERRLFIIEGKKAVYETLSDAGFLPNIKYVLLSETIETDYLEKISFINSNKYVKIYAVSAELFKKISGDETPEGSLCVSAIPERDSVSLIGDGKKRCFILLDSVNDPGNLGTIMRLADNFGISAVLLGKNSAFEYSPKVIKSSMGSFKNISAARLDEKIYGALLEAARSKETAVIYPDIRAGIPLREAARRAGCEGFRKIIIVGGSESHGVTDDQILKIIEDAACGIKATIPNYGGNESLNLSVAMGIFCYEIALALNS